MIDYVCHIFVKYYKEFFIAYNMFMSIYTLMVQLYSESLILFVFKAYVEHYV